MPIEMQKHIMVWIHIISVAKWKKLIAKTVKTRERFRGIETSTSESSTIPGLELYDTIDGKLIQFKQLVNNKQTFYNYPKLAAYL